jgi:hypothetical protein
MRPGSRPRSRLPACGRSLPRPEAVITLVADLHREDRRSDEEAHARPGSRVEGRVRAERGPVGQGHDESRIVGIGPARSSTASVVEEAGVDRAGGAARQIAGRRHLHQLFVHDLCLPAPGGAEISHGGPRVRLHGHGSCGDSNPPDGASARSLSLEDTRPQAFSRAPVAPGFRPHDGAGFNPVAASEAGPSSAACPAHVIGGGQGCPADASVDSSHNDRGREWLS